MRNLIFILFFLAAFQLNAQSTVPNGGFENWTNTTYHTLDNYDSEQATALFLLGRTLTTRDTNAYSGNYAVRMETSISGTDTIFGFITSGDFLTSNGFPYSQQPDSIVGYYKSNIMPGDTGIMVVRFSNFGNIFSLGLFTFTGVQSNWTRFAFPLSVLVTPDSAFFGAAPSNAVNMVGMQSGSWLMLDSVAFAGTGITQPLLNGDFENWTSVNIESPDDWESTNLATSAQGVYAATKTTDNTAGTYALRLETIQVFDDTLGLVTNGRFANDSIVGGRPFSVVFDTLVGQFKYSPVGLDSAAIYVNFTKNGNQIGGYSHFFTAQSTYTTFEVPFVLPQTPDTMRLDIISSVEQNVIGSVLFIDDLKLKSIVTSLDKELEAVQNLELYPNPATDQINLSFETINEPIQLQIVDGLGRVFSEERMPIGISAYQLNLDNLAAGTYYLRLIQNDRSIHRAFIVK